MMIGFPMAVAEVLKWSFLICSVPAAFTGGCRQAYGLIAPEKSSKK